LFANVKVKVNEMRGVERVSPEIGDGRWEIRGLYSSGPRRTEPDRKVVPRGLR
jgi:hypothetical protein